MTRSEWWSRTSDQSKFLEYPEPLKEVFSPPVFFNLRFTTDPPSTPVPSVTIGLFRMQRHQFTESAIRTLSLISSSPNIYVYFPTTDLPSLSYHQFTHLDYPDLRHELLHIRRLLCVSDCHIHDVLPLSIALNFVDIVHDLPPDEPDNFIPSRL